MSACKHCGKPLDEPQYRNGKEMKSCPKCSSINGEEHIFYNNPEAFEKALEVSEGATLTSSLDIAKEEGHACNCANCRGGHHKHPGVRCREV
ncbi:MAG: hypothetical protein LBU32_06305 [Clostridiales bacterium]|jgi:phage FluMu protein Com|nr:hypothetical protein [Clostridiales bacterium]